MKSVGIQWRFLATYKMSFVIQKYIDFNGFSMEWILWDFLVKITKNMLIKQSHQNPWDYVRLFSNLFSRDIVHPRFFFFFMLIKDMLMIKYYTSTYFMNCQWILQRFSALIEKTLYDFFFHHQLFFSVIYFSIFVL
jgi:hypothetical protein